MAYSTTTIAREASWQMSQDGENAAISARAHAERIASIASQFEFARDSENCFFTAAKFPVQLSMRLTPVQNGELQTPTRSLAVICRQENGWWEWLVEGRAAAGCAVPAQDLIDCVKQRIGAKLAGQLTGPVFPGGRAN